MEKRELVQLLARITSVEGRVFTEADVEVWHEAIGDLSYETARQALALVIRNNESRIKPAHIRARIADARHAIKRARFEREHPGLRERARSQSEARAAGASIARSREIEAPRSVES